MLWVRAGFCARGESCSFEHVAAWEAPRHFRGARPYSETPGPPTATAAWLHLVALGTGDLAYRVFKTRRCADSASRASRSSDEPKHPLKRFKGCNTLLGPQQRCGQAHESLTVARFPQACYVIHRSDTEDQY